MIRAANITSNDTVLEVGPGKGVLTEALLQKAGRVICIEKDPRLVEHLRETYREAKNLEIIEGDILEVDVRAHIHGPYIIVANLPYYLTSHFLRTFLETPALRPISMTVMVQYEVAKRIAAKPPDMNMLALSAQVYGKVSYIEKVPRSFFKPAPRVDSAIIMISDISDSFFIHNKINQKTFFSLTKKAFSQKRKKLRTSIKIDSDQRPQELSLENWANIIKSLSD